jgi:hypothetical protein
VCSAQDTCDGSGTCDVNDLIATTTCGDAGDQCTNQDFCDGSGLCGDSGFVANGSVCSDEDPETFDDQCSVGLCLGEAAPAVPMSSPPFRMLLVAALGLIGGLASYRKYGMSNRA